MSASDLPTGTPALRQVGDALQDGLEILVDGVSGLLIGFDALLHAPDLIHERGGVFAGLLLLGDLFGQLVALRFKLLRFGDGFATAGVETLEVSQQLGRILSAVAQFFFDQLQIGPHKSQVKHKTLVYYPSGLGPPLTRCPARVALRKELFTPRSGKNEAGTSDKRERAEDWRDG